uniref:RING-type E3 ubiquitin transferase n=1 Tax=Lotharella globosa TaxID=91324 RepID=A0A7S4DPM3_9EUKA
MSDKPSSSSAMLSEGQENSAAITNKTEAETKELKVHKENVDGNADEEASVRLALELMRQESWEMHRIMQHETLLAVQDVKRTDMNTGQNTYSADEDLRLALQLAEEERRLEEQLQAGDLDDVDIDDMTHEELVELGNRIGSVKQQTWEEKAAQTVANLPTMKFTGEGKFCGEKCLVCQCEYEAGEFLKCLPCNHAFHNGCISDWLRQNPECPLCKRSICPDNS